MITWIHLLRTVLIAPEIAVSLGGICIWYWVPEAFEWCDRAIDDLNRLVLLVPYSAAIAWTISIAWSLLFPKQNSHILARWPNYPLLRITVLIGVVYVVCGAATSVVGVVCYSQLPAGFPSLLIIIGYGVAGSAMLSMFIAALRIRSLLIGGQ